MKSSHQFSFRFDTDKLLKDLAYIQEKWVGHFNTSYYDGDWSGIPLRVPAVRNHELSAGDNSSQYEDTPLFKELSYFREVATYFQCRATSVRLLKLSAGSVIKEHQDADLSFWYGFVRLHVPVVTNDDVHFVVDGRELPMKPGECWFAEFCKPHSVENQGSTDRIHLVMDFKVNEWLRKLFEKEGILEKGEQKPDPVEEYSEESKRQIVEALQAMNTETSAQLAREIKEKYAL